MFVVCLLSSSQLRPLQKYLMMGISPLLTAVKSRN